MDGSAEGRLTHADLHVPMEAGAAVTAVAVRVVDTPGQRVCRRVDARRRQQRAHICTKHMGLDLF